MTIKEKISCSSDVTRVTLFKEGIFYKSYNQDAMVFVKCVREYKVSCKFIKSAGSKVYSIGFPASEIEKGKLILETISEKIRASYYEEEDKRIIFFLKSTTLKSGYLEWQKTIPLENKPDVTNETNTLYKVSENSIYNMIKDYDLANKTPM